MIPSMEFGAGGSTYGSSAGEGKAASAASTLGVGVGVERTFRVSPCTTSALKRRKSNALDEGVLLGMSRCTLPPLSPVTSPKASPTTKHGMIRYRLTSL